MKHPDSITAKPVALITGGARRVGARIVETLHGAGYRVGIHFRHSDEAAAQLAHTLNAGLANTAITIQADLLDADAPRQIVEHIIKRFGRLDLLVNNASSFYATPLADTCESQWLDLMGTNLRAPYFLIQAAFPYLSQNRGSVVNITDIYAEQPLPGYAVYCVAKAGLAMLTRALAKELGPTCRINGVAPGAMLWPDGDDDEQARQQILDDTALARLGDPQYIAEAVLYLAQHAQFTTGAILRVDGGRGL